VKKNGLWVAALLIAAAGWKLLLYVLNVVPFNSDEAVVGLMARHILEGERPIFFYGQSYMGSLDAILISVGFSIFGQSVWVIRLVQGLLYLCLLLTTVLLGREAFKSIPIGVLAALVLVVPTVNVTLYTTATLGGYNEALLIGNILMLQGVRFAKKPGAGWFFIFGLVAGMGLWVNALTLVFSVPVFVYMVMELRDKLKSINSLGWLAGGLAGALVGALPWWVYAWQTGASSLIGELLGSAVSVEGGSWLARSGMHLVNLVLLGVPVMLGLRPPWGVTWLALPLIPFALIAWGMIFVFYVRQLRRSSPDRGAFALLGGIALTLFAGFLFTSFGVDPSGRYFLPLVVPFALILGAYVLSTGTPRLVRIGVLGVILAFQVWGNLQCLQAYPPGFTTQFDASTIIDHRFDNELIAFLKEKGETRGYTTYWVAYPLAFLSSEEVLFVPRLPYHQDLRYTARDNRYEPYNRAVESGDEVAYITARNPTLDERLAKGLKSEGVSWQEITIGDYHVFYGLSQAVRPEELGLGESNP
jgi:4-amino-4-deoxy-L-arabinose transferase-like glycosyltransferase